MKGGNVPSLYNNGQIPFLRPLDTESLIPLGLFSSKLVIQVEEDKLNIKKRPETMERFGKSG